MATLQFTYWNSVLLKIIAELLQLAMCLFRATIPYFHVAQQSSWGLGRPIVEIS
jgi:hypothetical protein